MASNMVILLRAAARAVRAAASGGRPPPVEGDDPILDQRRGVFVTLLRDRELRGCIGFMEPAKPLRLSVGEAAEAASTRDGRFPPLAVGELPDLRVEVSILTPLTKIRGPDEIELGRHGIAVRQGSRSGVYLPQVAIETGWGREELLSSLCAHKAGLPPDAWRTGSCEVFVFETETAEAALSDLAD